jgi:hypothetical protein
MNLTSIVYYAISQHPLADLIAKRLNINIHYLKGYLPADFSFQTDAQPDYKIHDI